LPKVMREGKLSKYKISIKFHEQEKRNLFKKSHRLMVACNVYCSQHHDASLCVEERVTNSLEEVLTMKELNERANYHG
jgi:hypothetical protein